MKVSNFQLTSMFPLCLRSPCVPDITIEREVGNAEPEKAAGKGGVHA